MMKNFCLDIRLNTLDKYVDFFVIVESQFFHNGVKRQLKFNIDKFKKFKIKLFMSNIKTNLAKLLN